MIATQEKTIDGLRFAVTQLPAMKAFRTLNRIGRALGPALAKGLGALKGKLGDASVEALGGAATELFARLSDDELEALTRELLTFCTVDGKPLMPQFDLVMQGRMGTLLKLLRFAFEVNYGDFFAGARGLAAQAMAANPSAGSST